MPVIQTKINKESNSFASNETAMQMQVDDLREKRTLIEAGGPEAAKEQHIARDK